MMKRGLLRKIFCCSSARRWLCVALALLCGACAATPPPDPTAPRPSDANYPITMMESAERRQATLAAWEKLTSEQGITDAPAPELQSVTAVLRRLPQFTGTQLFLPKVGDPSAPQAQGLEDATTEALRRFVESNARLFGAEPQQLSLVLLTDAADGTRKAKYQQRPFRLPIRNGFGELEISFTNDRRILQITSTCIPDIEQLQRSGAGIRTRFSADEIAQKLVGRTVTYAAGGATQSYTIEAGDAVTVRELVIYPLYSEGRSDALEFHLAWEVFTRREPQRAIYVDAVTRDAEIIAVAPPA